MFSCLSPHILSYPLALLVNKNLVPSPPPPQLNSPTLYVACTIVLKCSNLSLPSSEIFLRPIAFFLVQVKLLAEWYAFLGYGSVHISPVGLATFLDKAKSSSSHSAIHQS